MNMKKFGYVKVSGKDQNSDHQIKDLVSSEDQVK